MEKTIQEKVVESLALHTEVLLNITNALETILRRLDAIETELGYVLPHYNNYEGSGHVEELN